MKDIKVLDELIKDLQEFREIYGGNVVPSVRWSVVETNGKIVWSWKPVEDVFYDQSEMEIRIT